MSDRKALIIIATLLIIAVAVGLLGRKKNTTVISLSIDPMASTTVFTDDPSYKIEYYPLPQDTGSNAFPAAPSLPRNVKYSPDLSPEVQRILSSKIAALGDSLLRHAFDFDSWMNLAIQYKTAGDYEGAREVWEYISSIYTGDAVALHNLGDLYQRYFNDFVKAEDYYRRAIAVNPSQSIDYLALHDLYRYSYKQNTNEAADILKKGIESVSGNQAIDLFSTLGSYYQDKNDPDNAAIYYTKARDAAQKLGNSSLAAQLDAALNELKK